MPPDTTQLLQPEGIKRVQQITGTLIYYAKAIDYTLLVALGTISSQKAKSTAATNQAIAQLLDSCATHPDAVLCYRASNMILKIHSDSSYFNEPKACSR